MTCWGSAPTAKWSITRNVFGSITSTVFESLFGTYTRGSANLAAPVSIPAPVRAYTDASVRVAADVARCTAGFSNETCVRVPVSARPPATRIALPSLTAARSEAATARRPAERTRPVEGSIARICASGLFVAAPRPPIT